MAATAATPAELTALAAARGADDLVVLDFWADWAAPCQQMNEVVDELARQYPAALFVKVPADDAVDLADQFNVEAVPTIVLLRRGKELARVTGADAAQLSKQVAAFVQAAPKPAAPAAAKPAAAAPATFKTKEEIPAATKARLEGLVKSAKCVAFIKGTPTEPRCGFTKQLLQLFAQHQIDFQSVNILADEEARQGLKLLYEWPTYPQVYVDGDLVGGLDIVKEMAANGELTQILPVKKTAPAAAAAAAAPLEERLKALINRAPVMLFMKGTPDAPQCGFSARMVALLRSVNATFDSFNILADDEVRQGLKTYSKWPTYPQLYVNGELVGGLDIATEMKESGELQELLGVRTATPTV